MVVHAPIIVQVVSRILPFSLAFAAITGGVVQSLPGVQQPPHKSEITGTFLYNRSISFSRGRPAYLILVKSTVLQLFGLFEEHFIVEK